MIHKVRHATRIRMLEAVLSTPLYIAILVLGAIAYYALFHWFIVNSNSGIFLVTVPIYLVYVLVASAALLLAVSAYAMRLEIHKLRSHLSSGLASVVTPSIGGIVASCGCQFSIVASVLYFLGLGVAQTTGVVVLLSSYQLPIIIAVILVNAALIYYNLGKLSVACSVKKSRGKSR